MANYIATHNAKFILNLCLMHNQFVNAHMQFLSCIKTLSKRNSTVLSKLAYSHAVVLLNKLSPHLSFPKRMAELDGFPIFGTLTNSLSAKYILCLRSTRSYNAAKVTSFSPNLIFPCNITLLNSMKSLKTSA